MRYGPQNVGGVINFKTRSIPTASGLTADASARYNLFSHGGANTQYTTFLGTQMDNGLGVALLIRAWTASSGATAAMTATTTWR